MKHLEGDLESTKLTRNIVPSLVINTWLPLNGNNILYSGVRGRERNHCVPFCPIYILMHAESSTI